jgi:hypothetical protein
VSTRVVYVSWSVEFHSVVSCYKYLQDRVIIGDFNGSFNVELES